MADIVFNIAKGRVAELAALGGTNDALVLLLLQNSGLVNDATMRDYDTVAAILAGASNEMTFTGYSRVTLSNVTVTTDDTNDRKDVDADDPPAWTNSGGSSEQAGKAIIAYDPDTTGGDDSALVPLVALDCVLTFDVGVETGIEFASGGFYRAS